tara:strand:+ start:1084 stop:1317 length:234 start_codon:yes stop_codon:yes gene_type:complete
MSKNQISEGIVDKMIEKIFGAIIKNSRSTAIKKLKQRDPELAKSIDFIDNEKKKMRANMLKKYGSYDAYEKAMLGDL